MKKGFQLVAGVVRAMTETSSLDDVHSWAASTVRGPRGLIVARRNRRRPPRPPRLLELYEFESCPFCRKVREAMTELDLNYLSRTCAKGAVSARQQAKQRGGKRQFPYLVDPNTGREMYESEQIVSYLADTYGAGRSRVAAGLSPVNTALAVASSVVRPGGRQVRSGLEARSQPEQPPVLYNIEASPYCRKVRERFNELNLDYVVRNVGKLSARRPALVERGGKMMVPYLIDPNTGSEMYESDDIIAYLEQTYGRAEDRR